MEMRDQFHVPASLLPVPIGQEAGWAPQPVWMECRRERIPFPAPVGIEPRSCGP